MALHGWLGEDGGLKLGRPTVLHCDERGGFAGSAPAGDLLEDGEHRLLIAAAQRVAGALTAVGYHGPFGIDAFRWLDADGRADFEPLSELNARYTMGWWTGME